MALGHQAPEMHPPVYLALSDHRERLILREP
jgi:hypothetical protein